MRTSFGDQRYRCARRSLYFAIFAKLRRRGYRPRCSRRRFRSSNNSTRLLIRPRTFLPATVTRLRYPRNDDGARYARTRRAVATGIQ